MTCIARTFNGKYEGVTITEDGAEIRCGTALFPLCNESGALAENYDGTDADKIVHHLGYQRIAEWEQGEDGTWSAPVKPLSEIYG